MKIPVVLALLTSLASPALAASPAVSRGEVLLSVSFDECLTRARATFDAEGFSVVVEEVKSSYVLARKDIHTAYITCSPGPNEDTWANIFVSSWSHDKAVPGAERLKLQARLTTPAK